MANCISSSHFEKLGREWDTTIYSTCHNSNFLIYFFFKSGLNECYSEEIITAVIALKLWISDWGQQNQTGAENMTLSPNQTHPSCNFYSFLSTKGRSLFLREVSMQEAMLLQETAGALLPVREKSHGRYSTWCTIRKNTLWDIIAHIFQFHLQQAKNP